VLQVCLRRGKSGVTLAATDWW